MFLTLRQKTLKKLKLKTKADNIHAEAMINFYQNEIDMSDDTEANGKLQLKISQLQDTITFNERFLESMETL